MASCASLSNIIHSTTAFTEVNWPQSDVADDVFTSISLSLTRMFMPQQKISSFVFEFHARITFSSSCLHDMTKLHDWNPWSQSAVAGEVGHAALVCRTACASVVGKWLHTLPSHPALAEPQGFSWGRLRKEAEEVRKGSPLYSGFPASAYYTCPFTDFTCDTGKCITKRWQCDFDNDCGNMEDERNCSKYAF